MRKKHSVLFMIIILCGIALFYNVTSATSLDITSYGAVADSDTSSIAVARNDAAFQQALTAAALLGPSGSRPVEIYFPPGTGTNFYALSGFTLEHDNCVILTGDPGMLASRIRLVSSITTDTGTSGIYFSGSHSWSGFKNIRIEAGIAMNNLIEIDYAHNAMTFEGIFINGRNITTNGIRTGGTRLRILEIYTSGFNGFNFIIAGTSSSSLIDIISGNHDVGTSGFMKIESNYNGTSVALTNQRLECATSGKKLIQYDTPNGGGYLNITGGAITGARLASAVHSLSGNYPPVVNIQIASTLTPDAIFTDHRGSAYTILAQSGKPINMLFHTKDIHYDDIEMRSSSTTSTPSLTMSRGTDGDNFSVFPDADEFNIKNLDENKYILVGGVRGVRIGYYMQPQVGKEGIQVSSGGVAIDEGAYNTGHLIIGNWHIWQDSSNKLRAKNGSPTSDTDGQILAE